jgi:hypothetical protein
MTIGKCTCQKVPEPTELNKELLDAACMLGVTIIDGKIV